MLRSGVPAALVLMTLFAAVPALGQGFSQPGQAPGAAMPAPPPAPPAQAIMPPAIMNQPPAAAGGNYPPPAIMGQPPAAAGGNYPPPAIMGQPPAAASPPAISPGFGSEPSQQQQPGQPTRVNYADELTDFGVPPQSTLQPNVGSATPLTIPGGHVITTAEMRQAVGTSIIFIDVWESQTHPTLPGAVELPGAGSPGSFTDNIQQQLWPILAQLANRQAQQPLVFFCTGSRCWESYNAALRAINMGFKMVLWYRGGLSAWQAAGQPMNYPNQGGGGNGASQPQGNGAGNYPGQNGGGGGGAMPQRGNAGNYQ